MSTRTLSTKGFSMRSRRVRAILAGGLVLGLGAVVTLATWNNSEYAVGSFAAGTFNLEGSSTDGLAFTEHATAGAAAALGFVVNPTNLAPGDTVFAPFAVRLAAGTSNTAIVTISNNAVAGAVTGLTYQLVAPTAWGCDNTTVGTSLVPVGTAVGTVPAAVTFPLSDGAPISAPGDAVFLCFKVTADAGLVQGQTGSATWEFNAVSQP